MLKRFLIFLFSAVVFIQCGSNEEKNMSNLAKVAGELNEKCPQMLDSETRLDYIAVKEPNTLVYNFTLVNMLAEKIDTTDFYRAMWPGLISTIKVSPEMKRLRENQTHIEYFYQDKNRAPVYTFRIGPQDYDK